jgi:hypothetical protein
MSPVRYDLGFYIPEDRILHNHGRENLKFYTVLYSVTLLRNHSTDIVIKRSTYQSHLGALTWTLLHYNYLYRKPMMTFSLFSVSAPPLRHDQCCALLTKLLCV